MEINNKFTQQDMLTALREKTFVKPGGIIEIHSQDLIPQDEVEVIIMLKSQYSKKKNNLKKLFGKGKGGFSTPNDVKKFISTERKKWNF